MVQLPMYGLGGAKWVVRRLTAKAQMAEEDFVQA
jgi:hypothetical protein